MDAARGICAQISLSKTSILMFILMRLSSSMMI